MQQPTKDSAEVGCPYCEWTSTVEALPSRLDQEAYIRQWEHLGAAHYHSATPLRLMSSEGRRRSLMHLIKKTSKS